MKSTKRTVGIASVPARKDALLTVVASIEHQVDEIFIALNGYESVPEELYAVKNAKYAIFDNSQQDSMKFYCVSDVQGYYFGLDDDLAVPSNYCQTLIEGIDKYNGLVSLHGRTYLKPVTHFKRWAGSYRCLGNVSSDVKVNFIGSGCCAFHTDRLKLHIKDFTYPGMADCFLSRQSYLQGVPMFVLKHKADSLTYLHPKETIWGNTHDYSRQTAILKSYLG